MSNWRAVFDHRPPQDPSCTGCCQAAWLLPLNAQFNQCLSLNSHESQREAAPQLFTPAYMWAVDWLPGDNEVRRWVWLAWTQALVEEQGLKVSAHTLPEVHRWRMNKPWAISLRRDRISLLTENTQTSRGPMTYRLRTGDRGPAPKP